jgi:hypothetical protein
MKVLNADSLQHKMEIKLNIPLTSAPLRLIAMNFCDHISVTIYAQ